VVRKYDRGNLSIRVTSWKRNRRNNRSANTPFMVFRRIFNKPLADTANKKPTQSTIKN